MSNIRHSLSLKLIGLVLMQNGIIAALLLYMAEDATSFQTIAIVGVILVAGLITAAFAGRIVGALRDLSAGSDAIAGEYLERRDEVGTIARELERLSRDNLQLLIEDDEERDRRKGEEAERNEQHARELDTAVGQTLALRKVVEALDHAMRRLATGDLRGRLDENFPDEFEGLRADFNHAMTSLRQMLERIESSTHLIHTTGIDMKEDSISAHRMGLSQTAAVNKAVAEVASLAETLRTRKMQTEHTANIAYNARIDVRGPRDIVHSAEQAMTAAREVSMKIELVAGTIREIAFQANMLAMNAGIETAHDEAQIPARILASGMLASDIRSLAERAAEAAKEISLLSRQSADAAERGSRSIEKADGEMDAMTIYIDAMKSHLDTIADSSTTEIEKVAALRLSILALLKTGRDQTVSLDALATRTDRMMREIGAIDHHLGQFTPVTAVRPGNPASPDVVKPTRRGSHLRLVKS